MKFPDEIREMGYKDRAFCELFADAIKLALLTKTPPPLVPDSPLFARASLLLTVFAIEGALNGFLDERIRVPKSLARRIDRMPFIEKAEIAANAVRRLKEFEAAHQTGTFADMVELISLRNRQVHPKSLDRVLMRNASAGDNFIDPTSGKSSRLNIPDSSRNWDFDTACTALRTADCFLEEFLLRTCALTSSEIAGILLSRVNETAGTWHATIMRKDLYEIWTQAKAECGLSLKFFAGSDDPTHEGDPA